MLFLPMCHDGLWSELRDPFNGTLSILDMDFPVHGREGVRCVQIVTRGPSGFPYLLELHPEKNLAVKLWYVGPQYKEQILDLKYFEADANLRQG